MKIILDECLPGSFKDEIPNHQVQTVPEMGWAGKKNGELLKIIQAEFDVLITVDRNLYFQQLVKSLRIAVVVLVAPTNRLSDFNSFLKTQRRTQKDSTRQDCGDSLTAMSPQLSDSM